MTRSKKDIQGMVLIGASVAFALSLFVARELLKRPPATADDCPKHVSRSTSILIDYSDSVASQTRSEVEARALSWIADSVAVGERVSVFVARAEAAVQLEPLFSRCRPRDTGNRLLESQRRIQRQFEEAFRQPLQASLIQAPGASNASPLAQVIIDLSLSRYLQADTTALLVFSDLMENTHAFSLYDCVTSSQVVERFRATRSGMQERPVFHNLRAMLHIIPRPGLAQPTLDCRDKLWVWFFGDNRGPVARVEPAYLPGGVAH